MLQLSGYEFHGEIKKMCVCCASFVVGVVVLVVVVVSFCLLVHPLLWLKMGFSLALLEYLLTVLVFYNIMVSMKGSCDGTWYVVDKSNVVMLSVFFFLVAQAIEIPLSNRNQQKAKSKKDSGLSFIPIKRRRRENNADITDPRRERGRRESVNGRTS
jgi:hypothetical protein